jgi:hypothetical protein
MKFCIHNGEKVVLGRNNAVRLMLRAFDESVQIRTSAREVFIGHLMKIWSFGMIIAGNLAWREK